MSKYMTIYKREYLRGTRTYSTRIDEEDLQKINDDLKKYATPPVEVSFKDLSIVWNNEVGEHLEAEIEVKNEWNLRPYKTTVWEYIAEYLRDWVYDDDDFDDDLECDGWCDDDWSDDNFEDESEEGKEN